MKITFFVPGIPKPHGSKKHVGRGILVESCKDLAPWREAIKYAAMQEARRVGWEIPPHKTPIRMDCVYVFPRPKSHYKADGTLRPSAPLWHTTKPDRDKLERATGDALTGVLYHDDSAVCAGQPEKVYTIEPYPSAGLWVTLITMEGRS